ncbi:MAG: DUF4350 domain-containing protein [Thermoproteus sp.]
MRSYAVEVALIAAAALLALIYLTPDPTPFGLHNPGPLGASQVSQICNITSPKDASVVIVAPGAQTPKLRPGLVAVLLGPDNKTLEELGVDIRVLSGAVTDSSLNALNPDYPLAEAGNYSIALYRPHPLAVGPLARALALTSPLSEWRGAQGPFAVAAEQYVGGAEVIVVSSPYAFTNALLDMAQNAQWLRSICRGRPAAYLGGVVDARAALWRAVRSAPQAIVLIPLLAALISIWRRKS